MNIPRTRRYPMRPLAPKLTTAQRLALRDGIDFVRYSYMVDGVTYGVIELRAALRVWRKVQACEVHDGVMIRTASGGIVRYNSAPSLLAWLKDSEV